MYVGIDLALRNTGIVVLDSDGSYKDCRLVTSDPKEVNDEELLVHNYIEIDNAIWDMLDDYVPCVPIVGLEGLSFNSKSSSVDLIAANHWINRVRLTSSTKDVRIIPPKSWMKSIVTKESLKKLSDEHPTVRAKRGTKLTKEQAAANAKAKAKRRKESKDIVLNSIPADVKEQLQKYVLTNKFNKDTIYDLADAYCIARHIWAENNG